MKELKEAIQNYFNGTLQEKYFLKKIKDLKKHLNSEEFLVDEALGFKRKYTPLAYVCIFFNDLDNNKRIIAIRELLKQGANPNLGEILPIVGLAQKGYLDALRVLVEEGRADIDKLSVSYEMKPEENNKIIKIKTSALSMAFNKRHGAVINFLLERNARVFHSEDSYSAIEYAVKDGDNSIIQKLLVSLKSNCSRYSRNDLHLISMKVRKITKRPELISALFDILLSPPLSEKEKCDLLIRAVQCDDEVLLDQIFALGFNPDTLIEIPLENGQKAKRPILHSAAEMGRTSIVKKLMTQYKADPFCFSEDGVTAFSLAVSKAELEVMKVMLEVDKALVDFKNKNQLGQTPLHIGVLRGSFAVVNFLLERRADLTLVDVDGCTPFYYAITYAHGHLISLFKKHHVNLDAPIKPFSKIDTGRLLRPITIAIALGHDEFIVELCKAGATPNYKEDPEASPLKLSMLLDRVGCTKKLLEYGAIPTTDDIDCLFGMVDPSLETYEIIKIFLQYFQEDPKKYSNNIYHLFMIAVLRNNEELTKIILMSSGILNEEFIFAAFFRAIIFNRIEILKIFFAYMLEHEDLRKDIESLMKKAFNFMDPEDQNDIKNLYDKFKPKLPEMPSITPLPSVVPVQAPLSVSPRDPFFRAEPSKSYTAYSYLRGEKQLSHEEIKELKAEIKLKKKKVKRTEVRTSQVSTPEEFTWFENKLHSSSMKVVENIDGFPQYICFAQEALEKQGCDLKLFEKDRYKLDNKSLKILKGSKYTRQFEINGKSFTLTATHELKTQESEDRILLFPVKSDDTSAILYVGAVFKKGGFHDEKDKNILLSDLAERLSVIKINFPVMSPAPTLPILT